jgi:hypothetical protein
MALISGEGIPILLFLAGLRIRISMNPHYFWRIKSEPWRLKIEPWMVYRPVGADSYRLDEEQEPDPH